MSKQQKRESLEQSLEKLSEQGIRADRKHLLEDIGSQFSDYREWIREYVVNASDAGASWCRIWGSENNDEITVYVLDDGHGMDQQQVIDFMTLFRSAKKGDPHKAVGRFGIGKASILAIPDLVGFGMETSNGIEGWKLETGSLLDNKPIHVHQLQQSANKRGTQFSITFKKKKIYLPLEMQKMANILDTYVRYLPMNIHVQIAEGENGDEDAYRLINDRWSEYREKSGRVYAFRLEESSFEVLLGLGSEIHEIYQNKVLITNQYNLFFYDLYHAIVIPGVSIRVDSPDFQLPFGRHGLRNEELLIPLSRYLRETILPEYFDELWGMYLHSMQNKSPAKPESISIKDIEELACSLLSFDTGPHRKWCTIPLFAIWGRNRISFNDLKKLVQKTGKLYLEDPDSAGTDYTSFDAPVLSSIQPENGLVFLKNFFKNELINLSIKDLILEQPATNHKKISMEERHFESFLGFQPEVLTHFNRKQKSIEPHPPSSPATIDRIKDMISDMINNEPINNEARRARTELEDIVWRVNYLVFKDGSTPCTSQKFLYNKKAVILNLYHPEIRKLLHISKTMPSLAGHWALAMCMEDGRKILRHLTPETREALIKIDALARSHEAGESAGNRQVTTPESMNQTFYEYVRSLANDSGLPE